jgi:uncharacterized protein YjbI with pentapeptide repeats
LWQGNPGERTLASEDEEQRRTAEARVKTGDFIARLMMAYAGFAAFCVFALLSPDRLVFVAKVNLNMPFAGNVSFLAFMVAAPALLIGMRFYLEVYVQHWRQLDADLVPETEPKTLSPLKHPRLRIFSAVVLYPLLPSILVLFAWKAAAKDVWGEAFLLLTAVCTAAQAYQFVRRRGSRRAATVAAVSGYVFIFVFVGVFYGWELPHRGLNLAREDLNATDLVGEDLRNAVLARANLSNADLTGANLAFANLAGANLAGASLTRANLTGAGLAGADLTSADLTRATLTDASLVGANLAGANLTSAHLTNATLRFAKLPGANLNGADLTGALLLGTNLTNADLMDAALTDAELLGADFTSAKNLTQVELDSACIRKSVEPPTLPEGLDPPRKICGPRKR